ncbi:MAG: hypothetical protein ACHP7N_05545 [Caulobacterales bacterium]
MNPVRFAPIAERAAGYVLELADSPDWDVERLGDFASVFNGPRFKRPFADEGVKRGPGIVRMFTPRAFFEERGESLKYLDEGKASRVQARQLDVLRLDRDWILVVDSGTAGKLLGKVGITTSLHEGAIGNNNLIRVVINDPIKRDYVYRFLLSPLGQTLLLRNVYGTNQDHIEPDDVKNIPVPIPRNLNTLRELHARVREISQLRERAAALDLSARVTLESLFAEAIAETGVDLSAITISPTVEE